MVEGGPNSSIFQEYCQHNTPNHGNNTLGFKGYQPGTNSAKPRITHRNDLDNNDIIIVVSSILFIFIVTIMISVLYYRYKQHIWEDGEEFLLTDIGFQPEEPFISKC